MVKFVVKKGNSPKGIIEEMSSVLQDFYLYRSIRDLTTYYLIVVYLIPTQVIYMYTW